MRILLKGILKWIWRKAVNWNQMAIWNKTTEILGTAKGGKFLAQLNEHSTN